MSKKDRKNYPQSQNVKAHKAAAKAALAERLKQRERLVLVPESGDMQIYVKVMTADEVGKLEKVAEDLRAKNKGQELPVKTAELVLFDSDGDLYFDPESQSDKDLLAAMPVQTLVALIEAHNRVNEIDDSLLKNLLAGGSSN